MRHDIDNETREWMNRMDVLVPTLIILAVVVLIALLGR
jgi:hypothetical protein